MTTEGRGAATTATIGSISQHEGKVVTLRGWLYNSTAKGKLCFLKVRDGTGIIQCVVFKGDVPDEIFELASRIGQETSLEVTGTVRADKRSPIGFELGVTELVVVSEAAPYPISPKEHGVEFLMDHRHLWLRSRRQHAILRVRHEIVSAIRHYLDSRGYVLVDAPILTPAACEGTSTLFETGYFGQSAFLTQSGQLYQEAGCMAHGRCYCFGPTFRAEKSKTRRHLTEFWMVEPEVAFMDLEEDMELAEDFVVSIVERVLERRRPELETLERDVSKLEAITRPFPRMSYDDAVETLGKENHPVEWGDDFGGDEETILASHHASPVIVHRFPAAIKAFYMKRDPENPDLVLGMDMLAPEGYGEIIGGGEREDDIEALERSIDAHGLDRSVFSWYLDLRRYGSVPHAGFGLGLERTVAWICGLKHVRETIPFPRLINRLGP
jgi:asparaginyl-tRNA synthetase